MSYTGPKYKKSAFNCPHCNAYAKQYWNEIRIGVDRDIGMIASMRPLRGPFYLGQ